MLHRNLHWLLAAVCLAVSAAASLPGDAGATAPPVSGPVPQALTDAFNNGLFSLPERPGGLRTAAVQFQWKIPIVLVSFPGDTVRYSPRDFEVLMFDTTGSVPSGSFSDYFKWASRGRLRVTGRVVAQVVLPEDRSYYAWNNWGLSYVSTPNNTLGAVRATLGICQSIVDWPEFDMDRDGYVDMLWMVHAGEGGESSGSDRTRLWSITSRMTAQWYQAAAFVTSVPVPGSPGHMMRLDRFTVLPELSAFHEGVQAEIGIYCHEFGHALGLPDLYDVSQSPTRNTGPGNWSLMSSGAYGGDGMSPERPSHPGAWPIQFLGWDRTIRPTRDTTLSLAPVADSAAVIEFSFQGEDTQEHFLIENRRRAGFDSNLPGEGLVIYQVDEAVISFGLPLNAINTGLTPGLRLVEADGSSHLVFGNNRGDPGDPFPGSSYRTFIDDETQPSTRTFGGAPTNLALRNLAADGNHMRFNLRVRAYGWLPPVDHTGPGLAPYASSGSARTSGVDSAGTGWVVMSEYVGGRPQVMLRNSDDWSTPVQISHSTSAAVDPSLALLAGGDIAVVWSDTRAGPSALYYRSRVRGMWTDERRLFSLPGSCRSPAIAADSRGGISLAFQYLHGDSVQIQFMRFTYFSPFGQPQRVVGAPQWPENPLVVTAPGGASYVLWHDANPPQQIWFAHYHPDSGLKPPLSLTNPTIEPQSSPRAVLDSLGALHLVYLVNGGGRSELRYQRRYGGGMPDPYDDIIASSGRGIQNPALAIDGKGMLHLAFESLLPSGVGLRYMRRNPLYGWDAASTDLSYPDGAGASRPLPLPTHGGDLSIAYVDNTGTLPKFMVRRRDLAGWGPVGVPTSPAHAPALLLLGPNPLRAGRALELRAALPLAGSPPAVEVFDLAGRLVASARLERADGGWRGHIPAEASRRWASGVYFARLRSERGPAVRFTVLR